MWKDMLNLLCNRREQFCIQQIDFYFHQKTKHRLKIKQAATNGSNCQHHVMKKEPVDDQWPTVIQFLKIFKSLFIILSIDFSRKKTQLSYNFQTFTNIACISFNFNLQCKYLNKYMWRLLFVEAPGHMPSLPNPNPAHSVLLTRSVYSFRQS